MSPILNRKPPQSPLTYTQKPESLSELAKRTIDTGRGALEEICSTITLEDASFENVILPLAFADNEEITTWQYLSLLNGVSPDPDIRKAAADAVKLFHEYWADLYTRKDLFVLIRSVVQKAPALEPESQRYIDRIYQKFIDSGFNVESDAARERIKTISLGIDTCIQNFLMNLSEHDSELWLHKDILDGVPQSTLDGLESSEDGLRYRLDFKKPDVTAILKHAHREDTRKRVFIGNETVAGANVVVFKDCLVLRDEKARLLGYDTFVQHVLQDRMAESRGSIEAFLDELHVSLKPPAEEHARLLRGLKEEDLKREASTPETATPVLYLWDVAYYNEKLMKQRYNVDEAKIAEYFPAQIAIRGMLDIFEKLFGLVIVEEDINTAPNFVWHPDVRLFSVWDDEREGGVFNGHLYTDINARDGKYGHNACFNISPGFTDRHGKRNHVSTALVCNLSCPAPSRPILLQHRQVITLFHELGHGMHDLLSRTKYARFHGYRVARDFGEMPSQMLEHWCWIPDVLKTMSRHYSYMSPECHQTWLKENPDAKGVAPPETIPDEMIQSLVRAKNVTQPLEQMRQIALSKFDMKVYGQGSAAETSAVNPSMIYNQSVADLGLVAGPESLGFGYDWGYGHVRTTHFIWSNEAGYYAYLFSQVFSADLFHAAFTKDPMSSEAGRRYRHMVLEKGGSQNEMKTLRDFLGRNPMVKAFRDELGI